MIGFWAEEWHNQTYFKGVTWLLYAEETVRAKEKMLERYCSNTCKKLWWLILEKYWWRWWQMNGFRIYSKDIAKRIKQCFLAHQRGHKPQQLVSESEVLIKIWLNILQAQLLFKIHDITNKNQVTSYIHHSNDLFMSQEQILLGYLVKCPVSARELCTLYIRVQQTTVYKTNMTHCMFSYGPQANNSFYMF